MGNSVESGKNSNKETLTEVKEVYRKFGEQLYTTEQKGALDEEDKARLTMSLKQISRRFVRGEQNEVDDLKLKLEFAEKKCQQIDQLNEKMHREILELKAEVDSWRTRFSKLAGEQLSKDNPNIADLSDKNRPTKLGEMYSELYDNEWTDAFVALSSNGHDDKDAIFTLRDTLLDILKFCKERSNLFMIKMHDAANLFSQEECHSQDNDERTQSLSPSTFYASPLNSKKSLVDYKQWALVHKWKPVDNRKSNNKHSTDDNEEDRHRATPDDRENYESNLTEHLKPKMKLCKRSTILKPIKEEDQIRKLQKDLSVKMVPIVQKAYLSSRWDGDCIPAMKPFIKKCVFISWMMVVSSPPMCFHVSEDKPVRLDGNMYKAYTQKGTVLDYVVWPPLMLHESGPLVCKGVAQAVKSTK